MKNKEIEKCKDELRASANRSKKKGYTTDWADKMFRVHVLELLEIIAKNSMQKIKVKRNPSKYNLHIQKEMSKGKTMLESIESWKK